MAAAIQSALDFATAGGTRGHSLKLTRGVATHLPRASILRNRVVKHWNRLPQELVDKSSVTAFKKGLDSIWNTLFKDVEV